MKELDANTHTHTHTHTCCRGKKEDLKINYFPSYLRTYILSCQDGISFIVRNGNIQYLVLDINLPRAIQGGVKESKD